MNNFAFKEQIDWRSEFVSYSGDWLEHIERDNQMETLGDISKALFENRSDLMAQAAQALIERKYGHLLEQEYCECPHCHKNVKAKPEKVKREVILMAFSITLYRPYFYCNSCRYGFYPLDDALGLSRRKIQPDVQAVEAWLAANMPFDEAAEGLKRCTGMDISNHHIHDVTNEIARDLGILDVCPSKDEIHHQIDLLSKGKFRRPVLMIGIDGAHAPVRPEPSKRDEPRGKGDWKEVKGFRMYLLGNKRIVHLISWHQIKSDKELAADLLEIKEAGLIPDDRVRICAIGDGAPWIWNRIQEIYPDAKKVLDCYHCSEYLHNLANAQFGKSSQKAREWVEATLTRLFLNQPDRIIAGIKRMKPTSDIAKEQIDKTINYLSERKDMIKYGSLKRGGYQIGSGGIESSNKFISNVRLKRSGAWWYPTNANNILKLRCAKYNGVFDRIVADIKAKNNANEDREERAHLRLIVDNS